MYGEKKSAEVINLKSLEVYKMVSLKGVSEISIRQDKDSLKARFEIKNDDETLES